MTTKGICWCTHNLVDGEIIYKIALLFARFIYYFTLEEQQHSLQFLQCEVYKSTPPNYAVFEIIFVVTLAIFTFNA